VESQQAIRDKLKLDHPNDASHVYVTCDTIGAIGTASDSGISLIHVAKFGFKRIFGMFNLCRN
jgi:hypothetical protein